MPNRFDDLQREQQHVLHQIHVRERLIRYSIALFVPVFGVVAVLAIYADDRDASTLRVVIVSVTALSTIPMAVLMSRVDLGPVWWSKQAAIPGINTAFLAYADIGVTVILITFVDPSAALHGSALFAIIGCYAAHFVTHRIRIVHMVFTSIVVCVLGLQMWLMNDDLGGACYRVAVSLLAINGTVFLLSIYTDDFQHALRTQLKLANTDSLTGLFNRRGFEYWAGSLLVPATRNFGVVVADIDNYKLLNDQFGHDVGDQILRRIAESLRGVTGDYAVLARVGGDEFAFATDLDRDALVAVAERMRMGCSSYWHGRPVTISVGVASCDLHGPGSTTRAAAKEVLDSAITAADDALYLAKQAGRNHVRVVDVDAAGNPA